MQARRHFIPRNDQRRQACRYLLRVPRIHQTIESQKVMSAEIPDNVTYIDEFRRERWLLKLRVARETGEIAVFGAIHEKNAEIIEFPQKHDDPDGAA